MAEENYSGKPRAFLEDIPSNPGGRVISITGVSAERFYREMNLEFALALDRSRREGLRIPLRDAGLLPNQGFGLDVITE